MGIRSRQRLDRIYAKRGGLEPDAALADDESIVYEAPAENFEPQPGEEALPASMFAELGPQEK
jgi:hypothetical protein